MDAACYARNFDAINNAEQLVLADKTVFVAGCGGLGGYVVEYLGRLGVGRLVVADPDLFEVSNLNRQLLSSHMNLGKPKVLAAKQRVQAINPLVRVDIHQVKITNANALSLISDTDVVVDALDNIPSRLVLQEACKEAGMPLVHGAIAGWCGQVCVVMPGQDLLDKIYPDAQVWQGDEAQSGSLSFSAGLVAALQAAEVVKLLLGKGAVRPTLVLIDLLRNEIIDIAI